MDRVAFEAAVGVALPFLETTPVLRRAFFEQAHAATLPPGRFICMEGEACAHLPLVLGGQARVYKSGEGREITLYRIGAGESCILTASCLLLDRAFPAFAITECEVQAALIPPGVFREWMARHSPWRDYVLGLLWDRLAGVISVVEDVTFRRMDARLSAYLLRATDGLPGTLHTTHEHIATELGSAREVISRLLKAFERHRLVTLARGRITVHDVKALRRRAAEG